MESCVVSLLVSSLPQQLAAVTPLDPWSCEGCECLCGESDESAAQLTPKQLSQINKELSTLQPVVDALRILSEQRQEVWHGNLFPSLR